MNGACDTCGEPAIATCAATGCDHEMCREHAAYKPAAVLDIANPPLDLAFCPQHADMAQET